MAALLHCNAVVLLLLLLLLLLGTDEVHAELSTAVLKVTEAYRSKHVWHRREAKTVCPDTLDLSSVVELSGATSDSTSCVA
jgi:hypothetical protein